MVYGRWLANKWGIDPKAETPAVKYNDGKDYVPTKGWTVFSHQFSSIAGAGPVTGAIQAAAFGWLPVLLWILIGGVFFGAVTDFGALYASVKNLSLIHILNEGILIAYDDTYYSIGDTLVIQKRLTDILKPCGMRYFTGRSLYKPEDPDRRDDIMYDAMKLLSRCEWIDNKNVGIFVIDDIISISFSDIDCSGMVEPKSEKYKMCIRDSIEGHVGKS